MPQDIQSHNIKSKRLNAREIILYDELVSFVGAEKRSRTSLEYSWKGWEEGRLQVTFQMEIGRAAQ